MHDDVDELGHVGCSTKAAMRTPPMLCGLTTRSAPARISFSLLSGLRALVTMNRSGLNERALNVMNEFSASPSTAATSVAARSIPA